MEWRRWNASISLCHSPPFRCLSKLFAMYFLFFDITILYNFLWFFFISFSPAYTLTPLLFDSILFIVVQNGGNVIGKVNATGNCAVCLRWIKPIEAAHTNEPEEWAMRERFGHRKMRCGRKKSDHHRGNIQILCLSISHHFSVMNFRRCPNDR